MKKSVTSLCLCISLSLLPIVAVGQSTKKRSSRQPARAPVRASTLKICQGVPVPAGYTIVGYVTSSACRHGAYVIKKSEDMSLGVTSPKNTAAPNSTAAPKNTAAPSTATASRPRRVRNAGVPARNAGNADDDGNAGVPARNTDPDSPTEEPIPPVLLGVNAPARRQPTLIGKGSTSAPTNADTTPISGPETGPEEVGEGDVLRVDTNFVTVPVSVMDRDGRFVPNLRREDFVVFENGVEQRIAHFEPTEKPFTVALLLDTSGSTQFHLWEIKEAAIAFTKQLRPQDRVLVVTFNHEVLLLTEVTNDLNVISSVIIENANVGDSTRLYDAVDLVVKERLSKIKGRKAIVLFTDGVDTGSYLATYQTTIRQAEELDALIYPIKYDTTDYARAMQGAGTVTVTTTTSNWPLGRRTSTVTYGVPSNASPPPGTTEADYELADRYLRELSEKTGARLYQANDRTQLAEAFSKIAEELRRQYSLGYYPQEAAQGGDPQGNERRLIRVKVRQPNLAVRARDSYIRQ